MRTLVLLAASLSLFVAAHAGERGRPAALRELDPAVGRWVFHGRSLSPKPGVWTWHADCRWSRPDRRFLECTFDNDWNGRPVRSLVVDTYNTHDHAFWHYEMFAAGAGGARPFVSRLIIQPDLWVEESPGRAGRGAERIVYHYLPDHRVRVTIEVRAPSGSWTRVDRGVGRRLPPRRSRAVRGRSRPPRP